MDPTYLRWISFSADTTLNIVVEPGKLRHFLILGAKSRSEQRFIYKIKRGRIVKEKYILYIFIASNSLRPNKTVTW